MMYFKPISPSYKIINFIYFQINKHKVIKFIFSSLILLLYSRSIQESTVESLELRRVGISGPLWTKWFGGIFVKLNTDSKKQAYR